MSGRATRFGTGLSWGSREPRKTWFPNTPTTSNDPRISAKLKRCDNHMASCRVRDRVNFQNSKGTIFGRWNADDHGYLRYVVYSYGEHYPLMVWDETIQHWFSVAHEDASSASVCTAGHLRRVGVGTATEVEERTIKMIAGIGLRDYVRVWIVGVDQRRGKLASDMDWYAATDRQLADPLLPAILRKPGGLTDMDEGVGSELRRDAELAFETLTNMGVSLVMLHYYNDAKVLKGLAEAGEHPYSKTRGLARLIAPANGHRMVLHEAAFTPKPGSKGGRHVVKFGGEVWVACFIECESAKHARELAHTLRTMRRMNGIEDPVNPERKD